ncbi:unnamed protein product [Brassica rapa subsp. trilocularis]
MKQVVKFMHPAIKLTCFVLNVTFQLESGVLLRILRFPKQVENIDQQDFTIRSVLPVKKFLLDLTTVMIGVSYL